MKIIKMLPIFLLFSCLCSNSLFGQMFEPYDNGPIHEGFMSKIASGVLLESTALRPPDLITERIPRQIDMQTEWLPGYWSWAKEINDFIWVSGVWRKPPPGLKWYNGFWKQYDQAWVWIPGFWSKLPPHALSYIELPPPDPIDEDVGMSPNDNYFWVPGFWSYVDAIDDYRWVPGYWDLLDPDWILVPAHYIWLPQGYAFIPAYWDWPLELRGTAYYPVRVQGAWSGQLFFEPVIVFEPAFIIERLFIYYPDYIWFFGHHHHFHHHFWNNFCCMPAWWGWNSWWGFSWHDHWSLWWWYSHPGFPHPFWMNAALSGMIPPPFADLFSMFSEIAPPSFVLKDGVIGLNDILNAIKKVTGKAIPLLPGNKDEMGKILDDILPGKLDPSAILKPSGKKLPFDPSAKKPQVKKPYYGDKIKIPLLKPSLRPKLPEKPRIPKIKHSDVSKTPLPPPIREPEWYPSRPPSYEPPRKPGYHKPGRRPPPGRRPGYNPPSRWPPHNERPEYEKPHHGPSETDRPNYQPPSRWPPENRRPGHGTPHDGSSEIERPNHDSSNSFFPPNFKPSFDRRKPKGNNWGFETPTHPPQNDFDRDHNGSTTAPPPERQNRRFEERRENPLRELERFE